MSSLLGSGPQQWPAFSSTQLTTTFKAVVNSLRQQENLSLICHRAKTLHPLSAGPDMALASMNIMVFMTATLHSHGHAPQHEGAEPRAAGAQRALATEGVICLGHIKKKKEKKRYNSGI